MRQNLPYSEFKRLNKKKIDRFDVNLIDENSPIGFILEVDLEYPNELHSMHSDYPLAPKKLQITQNMLSNYWSNIADECGIKIGGVKISSKFRQ